MNIPTGDNVTIPVELEGSPVRLEFQPPGVAYAVNLGGPTYEASNHIVYANTETTFSYDKVKGKSRLTREIFPQ